VEREGSRKGTDPKALLPAMPGTSHDCVTSKARTYSRIRRATSGSSIERCHESELSSIVDPPRNSGMMMMEKPRLAFFKISHEKKKRKNASDFRAIRRNASAMKFNSLLTALPFFSPSPFFPPQSSQRPNVVIRI